MMTEVKMPEVAPNLALWHFFVLERDSYTCQYSKDSEHNGRLETHHLSKDPALYLAVSNGITLCSKHHRTTWPRRSLAPNNIVREQILPQVTMFTVKEVAKKLKVDRQTVYRWIWLGKLEAKKIDGIIRIERKAYERFVKK